MTAAWDTHAPLAQLVTILTGLTSVGLGTVYMGVPAQPDKRVCAYVTIGGQEYIEKATGGLAQRTIAYRVVFTYAVSDDEQAAENALGPIIDAFVNAILADRTLGGTLERLEIDATEADRPQYALMTGDEFRQYPMTIRGDQRQVFPV